MKQEFLDHIKKHSLIQKGVKVLLAVSGGVDSVVMAELFRVCGFDYAIAHCNFGLRGKESDGEEKFVEQLAKNHKVKFYLEKFNTKDYSKKNKLSVQEAARELRYKWFAELCKKHGFATVATAHHLDDSIETFFINLFRGTGVRGLSGIPVKGKNLIRPMLFANRNEIITYARKTKLKWKEDSSNNSDDYLRNRIRKELIPVLNKLQPGFSEKMKLNFEHLSHTRKIYDQKISDLRNKIVKLEKDGTHSIRLADLQNDESPGELLSSILHSFGMSGVNVESILKISEPGKIIHSGQYRILVDRQKILIEEKRMTEINEISIRKQTKEVIVGNGSLRLALQKKRAAFEIPKEKGIHCFDASKVSYPLTIRGWKPGDSFYPLGMTQRKKLSDYFIDQKVNRFEKENCLVLVSGKDIVCILGHQIDNRYKVSPQTENILQLRLTDQVT